MDDTWSSQVARFTNSELRRRSSGLARLSCWGIHLPNAKINPHSSSSVWLRSTSIRAVTRWNASVATSWEICRPSTDGRREMTSRMAVPTSSMNASVALWICFGGITARTARLRFPPHGPEQRAVAQLDLLLFDEAESGVEAEVLGLRRLQVGGETHLVAPAGHLAHQRSSDASTLTVGTGAQVAEVPVVRLGGV